MKKFYFLIVGLVVFQANSMEAPKDKAPSELSLKDLEGGISTLKEMNKELAEIAKTLKESNNIAAISTMAKSIVFVVTCVGATFLLRSTELS